MSEDLSLYHYGVKGMRWGRRKDRSSSPKRSKDSGSASGRSKGEKVKKTLNDFRKLKERGENWVRENPKKVAVIQVGLSAAMVVAYGASIYSDISPQDKAYIKDRAKATAYNAGTKAYNTARRAQARTHTNWNVGKQGRDTPTFVRPLELTRGPRAIRQEDPDTRVLYHYGEEYGVPSE